MDVLSGTVTMKKSNRVITIDETQAKSYLARGYDQIDGDGKVTKKATSGKNITPAEYGRVLKELETLKAKQIAPTDINLQSSFEKLQADYDKMQAAYNELETSNKNSENTQKELDVAREEYEKLQAKYDDLEAKAKDFATKGKALQEENDKLKAKK